MNTTSATTSGAVARTASASPLVTSIPPIENSVSCEPIRSGTLFCEPPIHSRPTFWRMNEKPTAVISGASFGASRSGR